jgi:RHS repeat-associated protein
MNGRGMIGFRQMARSTFFAGGYENTKIWNGSELNPINEGLPFKDWSIRTTDELKIFPTDISLSNTQLLTFKQYDYKTDKLVDGAVVSTIANSDKPKVVTAISPYITISKDFLKNVKTVHTVETYNSLYLPVKSVDNINDGFAITTSEMDYYSSDLTPGSSYSIGKPRIKTSTVQAYGDTKSIKEEYSYENNLIKNIKTWNRDNTAYIQETYNYDGFGNIIQKTITNSTDSQTKTTSSEYDSKGRFAIKNTDHLGLQTSISYNDWGQILTQTDALGNYISNTYDGWGKILKSKKNLEGTTTYTYELIHGFSVPPAPTPVTGTKVTEYSSDGNQSIIYTDILGQVFKRSSKAFGQGKFISTDTQYDVLGRKISESEPYFEGQNASQWNTISYDDSVFPTKVTLTTFKGKQTETTISGATTTEKEINGYGRTTTKTTDALGNVISSTDKGGTVTFSYNAASEQTQAKYAENIVTTKYDSWGKKSEFNDPSNGTYKYEYNGFGLPKKIISPKGTKEFTYNNAGQLISQKELSTVDGGQATNKIISLAYDDKGRLISKSGTSKGKAYSSTVSYDQQGRLASSSESGNGKYFIQKGITYDDKGRVISYEKQLYSSGIMTKVNIQNVYSGWNGELFQVKDQTSGKVLWQLNDANAKRQVLSAKLGATDVTNTYDNNDFLTNINHSSAVKPGILQISYSFDAIKNELTSRTTGGDFNIIESFDYDDNNRLVNWTNPVTGIKPTANRNVYDIKGRIMENDQVGTMKYENSSKIYQPTGMTLNPAGEQNYTNDLIQTIVYNENNDPIFIDGMKGDVAFQYGITNMRQRVTYGGNFNADGDGTFTKFYSEDGSYEIQVNNTTGAEKHVIYIGGTPYESNIVFIKNYGETAGAYRFLHKDYLGSILAITDETGNKLEQRHFDAWGNMTHYKKGFKSIVTDRDQINMIIANGSLLIDRGYTGHEYFPEVGIIHMNGRLYDPLLRRFLNADENIQDPYNTQNYNKYGYVLNNPLLFNDPSGEYGIGESIVVAVAVAIFTSVATDYYLNRPVDFINLAQSITMAVASSMVSYGVGEIFKAGTQIAKALGETGTLIARAGAHALTQGALSYVQGGNFWSGALSGAFASASSELLGYATRNVGADNILKSDGFALFNGAVSGGVGSVLGGGNFWVGAGQGLIVTAFNYLAHKIDGGDPKPKSPIRKWLKNSSVTYPNGGGIMLDQQYQLDHENTLLEFKTFIEEATKFMDYLDTGSEWLGGVASVKGGWDFVKGLKDLKARAGITIFVGTMLSYNKYQINLQVEMYNQVLDKYLTMHANNPSHMKGITVNIVTYAGPYNNKFTNYRFYDIYSHRYLGGGEL